MRKLIKNTIVISVLAGLAMTACGQKKKSEIAIADDFNNVQPNVTSQDIQDVNMLWENGEKLVYSVSNVKVDADVLSDGVGNAQVYKLDKVEISDAYLISMAQNIFDQGIYEIKKPLEYSTLDELKEEERIIDEIYATEERAEVVYYAENYSALETRKAIKEYDSEQERNLAPGQVIYPIENVYENCMIGRIWGKIDGIQFELYYYENDDGEIIELHRIGYEPAKHLYQLLDAEAESENNIGNECDYDDAKKYAEDLIYKFGLSDYRIGASYSTNGSMIDPTIDQSNYKDGYRFEFIPCIDEIPNAYTYRARVTKAFDPNQEALEYANQPNVQIDVDTSGLVKVRFGCLYTLGSELSEDTSVMTFSQVDEMARNSFDNEITEDWKVNKIVFENVVVNYDGQYTSVPAWVYYVETNSNQVMALIGVNALDGSVVYFDMAYDQNLWFNTLDEIAAEDKLAQ